MALSSPLRGLASLSSGAGVLLVGVLQLVVGIALLGEESCTELLVHASALPPPPPPPAATATDCHCITPNSRSLGNDLHLPHTMQVYMRATRSVNVWIGTWGACICMHA